MSVFLTTQNFFLNLRDKIPNMEPINIDKIVKHWIEASDNDFQTMINLHHSKSYSWALFLGHITVEKLLKAYYVKKHQTHAPFTHNLYRLAELNEFELHGRQRH